VKRNARRKTKAIAAAVVLLVVLAAVLTSPFGKRATHTAQRFEGTVTRVYDGDTIEVAGHGKVRLLGIDALDGYNEDKKRRQAEQLGLSERDVARWAGRATERVRELVDGQRVALALGPQVKDDYGRLLAYVYLIRPGAEVEVNELLVVEGLATATRPWPHPRREEFIQLEQEARRKGVGLWGNGGRDD